MDAKLLVLLSFVSAAIAGPLNTQDSTKECATECIQSTNYKYNPGTTYVYDYRVDTDSSLVGAFKDSAKTTLQTHINIEVLSPCEFSLRLTNTRLSHSTSNGAMKTADRENEFRSEVEQSPLRFSFQNGGVDHVCADKDETVRSLNLKKGILSAFQNNMDDLTKGQNVTETDVVGTCKTEYKLVSNGYYTTEVKKTKDILSCSDRLNFQSMLQLTSYKVPSDLQNLPIMKTSHDCDQTIQNGGVLKISVCKESHVYRPFANGENGARTAITQTLTYQTYRNGVSRKNGNVQSRSSLLFDHSADHMTKEQSRMAVEVKLNTICGNTKSGISPETPGQFTELVIAMKGLDTMDLNELHRLLKTKTMCPTNDKAYKFFHDALPMLNTKASVRLMTELINSKDVTGVEAKAWLTSLAFIQAPTSDMLLDVKTLLDNEDVRTSALLPVSSMVNNFCNKIGTCNQDNNVLSLISLLERNIDYDCDASGDKFELTLLTLKAIGNAGHAIRAIPVLNKCMTSTSNPLEIRIAAAEAFRRMPCDADTGSLWNTFSDKNLDSELRINAYLSLMQCPSQDNLGKMAKILNAEEDEQVGAFVYSHLTNLKETSDPHKQSVADSINNLSLDKEFDLSPLKFSRNFEVSALLNKINTGITAESNLIWSNKVQIPRAMSANLTVQLFGQSINLLDFGGRFEGLEYLIKNVFGQYINNNDKAKMNVEDVKGSFYGRIFGNEMLFMHSKTVKSLIGSKTPTYLDILIHMSQRQQLALTQSIQFMDVCMVIPSSAGLPLHVSINGTATVDLQMSGKMDLRKAGAAPRSMDIDGEIRPSAALEVTGSMFVDSIVTKTGMRMRNTMHSSSVVKGRIQMTRGQQLNVELDTPEDKIEIFDARSKFALLHDDIEQEQEMIKENRKEFKFCSGDHMIQITGMELCGELSFPNASMKADSPYFPFTGPTTASVTLSKRDTHSGYKLFAKKVDNRKASIAQISINTPGSRIDRAISVDMTLNYKKQDIEMSLASPWKKLALNGNLINSRNLKSLKGSILIDEKDSYAVNGEVKMSESKTKIQINPMLELTRPGVDNVQVTGFIAMEKPLKSVNMEMTLSGLSKIPYTLKSSLTNDNKEKSIEASMSLDGKTEYSAKASNKMSIMGRKSIIAAIQSLFEVRSPGRKLMSFINTVDYREDKSLKLNTYLSMYRVLKKPASFKVNILKTARRKSTNYKGVMNLKTSCVSGNVIGNINKKHNGFLSVTSKIDYTIPRYAKNTINLSGKFNDRSTRAYTSYTVQSNIGIKRNPEYNSNVKLELGHKKKLSYVSADVKYGANPKDKSKRVYLLTSVNRKIANLKNAVVNYKVKAQAPAHNIDVSLQGKHEHSPKHLDTSATLSYAPNKDISAAVTLRNRGAKLAKLNGEASLSWPGQDYVINTQLTQKNAKQYAHVLNYKSKSGTQHTISTVYKMPKSRAHDVVVAFKFQGMKPVVVSASTNLNSNNFAASGEFKTGKNVYGINTLAKFSKAPSAKISVELIHPERRVTLDVNGGKGRGKYEGKIETAWDADNDKNQKMSVDGSYFRKSTKGATSMGASVNFRSPFSSFENLATSFKYGMDASQHAVNSKILWGDNSDQIITTMTVGRPISLKNIKLNGNIKTPFRGFRTAKIDIAHKMDSGVSTSISGELEKEFAKLTVQGEGLNNGYKGSMNLKSTIQNAESITLSGFHTDVDNTCNSNLEMNHNGKVYSYDLSMTNSGNGWQREASGDLVLTLKKQKIASHWNHKNTDATVESSFSSEWDSNRFAKVTITGEMLNQGYKGSIDIKSTIKNAESISLSGAHNDIDNTCNSNVKLNHNGKVYSYDLSMTNAGNGWQRAASGDLVLTLKKQTISTHWDHKNTDASVKSSLSSEWNNNRLAVDLIGSHQLSSLRNINGVLKISSPWKTVRDVEFNVDHKHGSGLLDSIVFLRQGSDKKASYIINYKTGQNSHDFDVTVVSPFHKQISGKFNTNYDSYPMTTSAQLQWAPRMKGTIEGSLNLDSWSNADINLKMTTPSRTIPNVVLKASNNNENGETVSNVNVAYGMRQNIDIESRISNKNGHKMLRLKLSTPFEQIKSVSTGLNFNGNCYKFDTTADFELLPSIGKFDGAMNWQYENELNGKIRIDTPLASFPYFELATSSRDDGTLRKSHIQAEYHPHQVYSLDSTYSFGSPMSFDTTIRSPYQQFDDIGLTFQHELTSTSVKCHGEVRYEPSKRIEADLDADWATDLESNFAVKTPFTGYQNNKISMRHRGGMKNFNSHGEINISEQNIVADASFKSGYTTTGTFTFSSPIPGMESIDVSLRKRGNINNFKGGATIKINGDKFQTTFNNKMATDYLKTNFNLITPHTEAIKFAIDHSGPVNGFNNKINFNYGRKVDIDTISSVSLHGNDMNANGILKYKLDKGRNTARVSFSKNGPAEDVSFSSTANFNRDEISITGSLKTIGDIDGSLQIKTPFKNFKNTGMTLSHSADVSGFTSNANINYMGNKNINGKMEFSTRSGMKLSGELNTPFKTFESTSFKVNHDINAYSGDVSGTTELTTTIRQFGTGHISYSKMGSIKDLVVKGSATLNQKELAVVSLTNKLQNNEIHSIYSLTSVATPDMYFSIDHSGDSFSFNTKTVGKIGKNIVSTDGNMKRTFDTVSADSSITYKLQGQRENKASVVFQGDSSVDNYNMVLTGKFNDEEVKFSTSKTGELSDMRFSGSVGYNRKSIDVSGNWKNTYKVEGALKVVTPFVNYNRIGASLSHSAYMSDFLTALNVNYMDDKNINAKVELVAPSLNNVKFASELTTPFENFETLSMKFNNNFNTYTSDLNGKAAIETSTNGFGKGSFAYSKTGSLNNFEITGNAVRNGVKIVDSKITWKNSDNIEGVLTVLTPFDNFNNLEMSVTHVGDLPAFTTTFNVNYMDDKKINGKLELTAHSLNNVVFSTELATPFEPFKTLNMNFNNNYDTYTSGLNGNAAIETSINGFGKGSFAYSKTGSLKNFEITGNAVRNGVKIVDSKITWKNSDNIEGVFTVLTPFDNFNNLEMSVTHVGDLPAFTTTFNVNYMDDKKINGKLELTAHSLNNVVFSTELATPFEPFKTLNMNFNNNYDTYTSGLNGNAAIETSINGFGKGSFAYSKTGSLKNFEITGNAVRNGVKIVDSKITWKNSDNIEGVFTVLTPFDNFNKLETSVTHVGDLPAFTTTFNANYMDDKKINGKVELTAHSLNNVVFSTKLVTPFKSFKTLNMNFNNNYDTYTSDLTGNVAIDTSIAGFGTGSIAYSKTGGLNNLKVTGDALRNGVEIAELKITNSFVNHELFSSFDYQSSATPRVRFTFEHKGEDLTDMKSSATASFGERNLISAEATLSQRSVTFDAETKLLYNIYKYGNNHLSLSLHKEGSLNNFNVELTGKNGAKTSKVIGNFKNEGDFIGDLNVKTPFDGYENVGVSFKHSGSTHKFNCNGKVTLAHGKEFSGKFDFYRHLLRSIEVVAELKTPITGLEFTQFEYKHKGDSDSLTCFSELRLGDSKTITYDMQASTSYPKPELTITLKTPQEKFLISGAFQNTWPRYALTGKLDAGIKRVVSLDFQFDGSYGIGTGVSLSTPFDGFNKVSFGMLQTPKPGGIQLESSLTYMDGQTLIGKVDYTMGRTESGGSFELTTPFNGYEYAKLETRNIASKRIMKTITKIMYGDGQRININAYSKFIPFPELSITIQSPFSQAIEAFVSIDNTWPKYELTCRMNPGNGDKFTLGSTFDARKDISGVLTIETPYDNFNKIGMNFMHTGDGEKFETEGTVNYMDGQEMFGKVNFYRYMWRRVDASVEVKTPFTGMETTKAEVNFEDNSNSISTTAAFEYNNGDKLNGNVKVTYSPSYDVSLTVNTPTDVIKAQGAVDLTAPNYEALCSLNYGYGNVYSANGKINLYSIDNMAVSLEINTPMSGFQYTKAEYEHKLESTELTGAASLTFDDGKKMNCEVKSTFYPNFDGTVIVKTPFSSYEHMQASVTFESSYNRYETSSSLNLGQGNIFSMVSELDYSIEPMKASTKISTPSKNFRNIDLTLSHEGRLSNFKTTGFLYSPLTDHVNVIGSLRYDAVMDMTATASIQSSLEGFDDLKTELKTSNVAGEMKANALIGWTSGQQVTLDGTFHKLAGWNEDKLHTAVSLTTPFSVRSVNMQMDNTVGSDSYAHKMNFELNGDGLVDYEVGVNFNDKTTAELVVRQPRPMIYTTSISTSDAEVFANWNRDEPDSNARVQVTMTGNSESYQQENSLDFSVTHASRKVGVVNRYSNGASQILSNGHIYWDSDDASKVSYDLQLNQNNRRRKQIVDGSFKLGLPTRTLGLTGSYSKNPHLESTDVAFNWDADRDDSKQVGIKTNTRLGDTLKGDITINMPSLRKEIRVDGEVVLNNGRIILDTKTDIAYSRDSRKTLTLTSKLEDISTYLSHFNYSLALGLKHPHTNLDIAVNSHIGSSDEKMTFGVSSNYLTSKRQMKNLALLSEINTLKKQINVQVFNPDSSIEVIGDVVSETPYTLRMMNKIDGQEAFRSDMTFDKVQKSFVFNTFTHGDIMTFAAKYPNSSAFRVDFTRHTPDVEQQEALLAVRLNTSRLLHTRLSWRPDMMADFNAYAWPKVRTVSESAIVGITSFNDELAEEMTSKYTAITNEISQELQPFITALDQELTLVAEKMKGLSTELRKMYDNNDMYVQNLGEGILSLQAKMDKLAEKYTTTYTQLISSLNENLYEMRRFNAGAHYKHFVTQTTATLVSESIKSLASVELYMAEVDQVLQEYKQSVVAMKQRAVDTIYNTTIHLTNQIPTFDDVDVSPYISSFDIPQEYTNAAYEIPSKIKDMVDKSNIKFVKESFNEVYQQGIWSYNYWQLEENLEKHAKSILKTLKDIVEAEINEYSEEIKKTFQSPITVWDPEHGEIQAEFPLPIAIHRLDQTPNMAPLVARVEKIADTYMPDETTLNKFVGSLTDMLPAKTPKDNETSDGLDLQVTEYRPSKKYRKKGRKYKVKRSRQ